MMMVPASAAISSGVYRACICSPASCASASARSSHACGTAAVISPIGVLRFGGEDHAVRGGGIGPVSQALYDAITGIQYGRISDTHGWVTRLAPAQAFPCGA